MSEPRVKLTTYLGERDRGRRGPLADELLDLYAEHGVRTGVLLRGGEGFGRLHHRHTDRLLSLSEDLPVVAIALDTPERIDSVLTHLPALQHSGLATLELTRLASASSAVTSSDNPGSDAEKLTVFVGRTERVGSTAAFAAICEVLHGCGLAGASVLLGVDGLRDGTRRRARFFSRNADVPVLIEAVGSRQDIATAVGELRRMTHEPLMSIGRVDVCKRDGQLLQAPHVVARGDRRETAPWQKLTIYSSHDATHGTRPLHSEIVRRLRAADCGGVTCMAGIWGFHGRRAPHGDRLLQLRRHVPVMTVMVDSPERIARSFAIIDELTGEHGLVTSEPVAAAHALSGGERLGSLRLPDIPA